MMRSLGKLKIKLKHWSGAQAVFALKSAPVLEFRPVIE